MIFRSVMTMVVIASKIYFQGKREQIMAIKEDPGVFKELGILIDPEVTNKTESSLKFFNIIVIVVVIIIFIVIVVVIVITITIIIIIVIIIVIMISRLEREE